MKVLLDTHALLWFLKDDARLSPTAKSTIEDASNHKLVSMASCWEMAVKASLPSSRLNRLGLNESVRTYLERHLRVNHFDLLMITFVHATAVEHLPMHHGDPFDRLIVAQSQTDGIPVISHDQALDHYGIQRIW